MAFALFLALGLAFVARAHDPGLSTLQVNFDGQQITPPQLLPRQTSNRYTPSTPIQMGKSRWKNWLLSKNHSRNWRPNFWKFHSMPLRLPLAKLNAWWTKIITSNSIKNFPAPPGSLLTITSRWPDIFPPGHRQFVSYQDETGEVIMEDLLDEQYNVFEVTVTPVAAETKIKTSPPFSKFFVLGIEHILTGYDHLLFLFALLIVCESFASIVKIVTCFTLAHSLTLALATFDVVQIPGEIVEPIIAASIVYVGVENIFRRGHPKWRWLLTFAFGLVHGFGFAGVLRELGIAQSGSVAVPLVAFNLGVEFGQICVAAIILPLLWQMKKLPKFAPRFVPACSVLVAAAGAYWFIQRVWF